MRTDDMRSYMKCCKNCGHCTYYRYLKRYECGGVEVKKNGICDRWQKDCTPNEIMKKIDKKLKELENVENGTYKLKVYPALRTNYREQTDEEMRENDSN